MAPLILNPDLLEAATRAAAQRAREELAEEERAVLDPYDLAEECPFCYAPNLPTGTLGRLVHYHCRDCGQWYAIPNPELDA